MARHFRRDPLGQVLETVRQYGSPICSRLGPWRFYSVTHPEHVRHVLHDNHKNYVKGELVARAKVLIGEGLFSSEGEVWRRQRRTIQPAFDRARIASLAELISEATELRLQKWAEHARRGEPFDLTGEMTALTLEIAARAFFGVGTAAEIGMVGGALQEAFAYVDRQITSMFPRLARLPSPRTRRFQRALRILDDAVSRIIARRRDCSDRGNDVLSLLLNARDPESGEEMSDQQLRDEVMTFALAGHETTALTLTWALYLLAADPEAETRLQDEARETLGGRAPRRADLDRLPYARRVLDETLRLYPPVWAFAREPIADDRIGGYRIRAGAPLAIVPYATHRLPECWDAPDRFDPDRFTPERSRERPRYAYLPFGGGPRQCIGREFALMEAQLVLTAIAQRFRLTVATTDPVLPAVNVTLRPATALPVRVRGAA